MVELVSGWEGGGRGAERKAREQQQPRVHPSDQPPDDGRHTPGALLYLVAAAVLVAINRLSNPGDALGTALQLADRLNHRAPNALASIKELLNEAPQAQLTHHLGQERDHFVKNLHHANGGAGISAFLEKRVPRYE